jgi:hypothetical protein
MATARDNAKSMPLHRIKGELEWGEEEKRNNAFSTIFSSIEVLTKSSVPKKDDVFQNNTAASQRIVSFGSF